MSCGRPMRTPLLRTAAAALALTVLTVPAALAKGGDAPVTEAELAGHIRRSEEHTSELQSLMRLSYAVFCLKKKKPTKQTHYIATTSQHKRCRRPQLQTE